MKKINKTNTIIVMITVVIFNFFCCCDCECDCGEIISPANLFDSNFISFSKFLLKLILSKKF